MDTEFAIEVAERLSKLESAQAHADAARSEMKESIDDIKTTLGEMKSSLDKYQGFWGGALLVISAIWAFIELAGGYFMEKFKGG